MQRIPALLLAALILLLSWETLPAAPAYDAQRTPPGKTQNQPGQAATARPSAKTLTTDSKAPPDATAPEPKSYLPVLPEIFDVAFDDHPSKLVQRLLALGYERTAWRLEAPYTTMLFELPDKEAAFRNVQLQFCNHPLQIARLILTGRDREHFYETVQNRFTLGLQEKQVEDDLRPSSPGTYHRDYARTVKVTLSGDRARARLEITSEEILTACPRALDADIQEMRTQEAKKIETARKNQREKF